MSNSTEQADKEALKDAISSMPNVPEEQRAELLEAVDRGEIKAPTTPVDYIEVIITQDPPIGAWCFGMKGCTFKVVDRGRYYMLLSDINLQKNRRCLVKDHVCIVR